MFNKKGFVTSPGDMAKGMGIIILIVAIYYALAVFGVVPLPGIK